MRRFKALKMEPVAAIGPMEPIIGPVQWSAMRPHEARRAIWGPNRQRDCRAAIGLSIKSNSFARNKLGGIFAILSRHESQTGRIRALAARCALRHKAPEVAASGQPMSGARSPISCAPGAHLRPARAAPRPIPFAWLRPRPVRGRASQPAGYAVEREERAPGGARRRLVAGASLLAQCMCARLTWRTDNWPAGCAGLIRIDDDH